MAVIIASREGQSWRSRNGAPSLALVLLAPCANTSATEANFGAKATSDPVELCDAPPDNAIGNAAINFCEGFAQGAMTLNQIGIALLGASALACVRLAYPKSLTSRADATAICLAHCRDK